MADSSVAITAGAGTPIRVLTELGAASADQQVVTLADSAGNLLGTVANPVPIQIGADPDTAGSGTITATDVVVAVPAGAGAFVSGTPTAGSTVVLAAPGGDAAWMAQITGQTTGNIWFEGSLDSTNGTDGQWINLNGRQTGVVNTVLAGSATVGGLWRGNVSGIKYFRVRQTGTLTGTPAIVIRLASGSGAIFLNASIPAGTNMIGSITGSGIAGTPATGVQTVQGISGGTALPTSLPTAATPTITSPANVTTTAAVVLAANTARRGGIVYNESGAIVYLAFGTTATLTAYTVQIAVSGNYEVPFNYTGALWGITSAGTAVMRVTELTV